MSEDFDFAAFKAGALEALQAGKPLTGKDGILAPLLENLLNAALEGEMDSHMSADERDAGNRRNGYGSKQVQSSVGELTVQTPRDRDATFDPQFIKKRERILADSLSERILGLYALGTSTREISELMEEQLTSEKNRSFSSSPLGRARKLALLSLAASVRQQALRGDDLGHHRPRASRASELAQ